MNDLEDVVRRELRRAADEGPAFVVPEPVEGSTRRRRWPALVAAAAVLVAGGVAYATLRQEASTGSADCAFVVTWDGRQWSGVGLDRTPDAGGVLGEGVVPGCDDLGHGPGPSRHVEVRAVRGVDPSRAVLVGGEVLLPVDATGLPPGLDDARDPVRCDLNGTVELEGRWTGVTSRRDVRYDGDVRPPYRIDFVTGDPRVTDGYAQVLLHARGTAASRPLAPADVKRMLWHEAEEVLTTHCEGGRFVVDSLDPAG